MIPQNPDDPRPEFAVVTSWNDDGYELYGKRFIATFLEHWPAGIPLIVMYEGEPPVERDQRLYAFDLKEQSPGLVEFLSRHTAGMKKRGFPKGTSYNYRFDAVRFSKKVFAMDAVMRTPAPAHKMIWLDGDVVTHTDVPMDFLRDMLGEDEYLAYLKHEWSPPRHTESGFLMFDTTHPLHEKFFERWTDLYRTDELFGLKGWTDCHALDKTMSEMETLRQGGPVFRSISGAAREAFDVFGESPLGAYMDHLRGMRKQRASVAEHEA